MNNNNGNIDTVITENIWKSEFVIDKCLKLVGESRFY